MAALDDDVLASPRACGTSPECTARRLLVECGRGILGWAEHGWWASTPRTFTAMAWSTTMETLNGTPSLLRAGRQRVWYSVIRCVFPITLPACASSGVQALDGADDTTEVVVISVVNPNSGAETVYAWWGPNGRLLLGTVNAGASRVAYRGPELGITSAPVSSGSSEPRPPGRFRRVQPGELIETELFLRTIPG
jgi:hypothetical protein